MKEREQHSSSSPADWCPSCPWAAIGGSQPTPPAYITGHEDLWSGTSPWAVGISCPGFAPSQLLSEYGKLKIPWLGVSTISISKDISVLPTLFPHYIQNINLYEVLGRKLTYPSQNQDNIWAELGGAVFVTLHSWELSGTAAVSGEPMPLWESLMIKSALL